MKYVPVVGETCEYKVFNEWGECTIDFMGKELLVYSTATHNEFSLWHKSVIFRPIKTEREKFVEAALEATTNSNCYFSRSDIIGLMYDSGLFQLKDKQDD